MEYTKSPFLDSFCRALAVAMTARGLRGGVGVSSLGVTRPQRLRAGI